MNEGGFFFQAFVYLAAAVISVPVAKKLGLGSVLGYLLAGVIIGPFVLGLIGEEGQDVMHFAEFGVVMMLFLIGLELQPALLWKLRNSILGMGGSQVLFTGLIIMGVAFIFNIPWQTGLALGLTLSLSSTAIVLQTLNEKGQMKTTAGQNAFSVLLFQDIAVIPILAFFPLLAVSSTSAANTGDTHHAVTWIDGLPIWGQTLVVLLVVGLIVVVGRYLISPAFRLIALTRLRELFTAASLLLVIGIAILMTKVGLSPALGTFLAGVVLAQSEYRHELETDVEPFKGLLLGLFFIAVGASIDFNLITSEPLLIAELVAALIFIKFIVLFIIGRFFKMGLDSNLLFSFALAQGGEFAFVLFSFAVQNNVIGENIANPMIAVVAVTMALTPLLMLINEKLVQPFFGTKESESPEADSIDEKNKVIIAGFGRFGSTIGRFLQANGVMATYLDIDPDNVDLLRKMGLKVFYGDASRVDLLQAAGAEDADMLIIAVDSPDKTLEIVETAQKNFPGIKIMARSYSWDDSYELLNIGINDIYRETLDSALQMGVDALCKMGYRKYQTHRAAKTFRKHDERFLRELAEMRHDKKQLISGARQRIAALESAMQTEIDKIGRDKDLGWDATTLIEEFGNQNPDPKSVK
ncbi:MAG: cation:proton antiporter [Calditrichae bacterium]|nr:monovalent cation:proton antiporter-2 (CPA2) family protein [Calditrichota bacterium]MCB9059416.1 cation:proton antiporter [Calditrichia bacterium]